MSTSPSPGAIPVGVGTGTVLAGRYRLGEVLGHGGMAVVHRAVDELLERPVAVKVLHDRAGDETDRARFSAEAKTLAALSHSGVVMVLDAGLAGDHAEQPFLVMELVEGMTLAECLRTEPLDLERAGSVGVQLAEALAYAHDRGVVHRDVKPANVLLADGDRVKLADFGIARLVGESVGHTRTGTTIGTAAYLSPEQVQGQEVSTASDVYSLGLVLLEALTGEREFPGTPTEAALARLSRPPRVPDRLPTTWRNVLTDMTCLDPAARPPAAMVAQQLRSEPTGPIPLAVVDQPPDPAPHVPDAGETHPLAEHPAHPGHPVPPEQDDHPVHASFADRAGDAIAQQASRLWERAQALDANERGVVAAVGVLLLFLLVVGLAT